MTEYSSYMAEDLGLRVNSHYLDTGQGVVLVDTQLHLPYADLPPRTSLPSKLDLDPLD